MGPTATYFKANVWFECIRPRFALSTSLEDGIVALNVFLNTCSTGIEQMRLVGHVLM
jgi:hypothetical protein